MLGPPGKQYGPAKIINDQAASALLRTQGVRGIKYFDQQSRAPQMSDDLRAALKDAGNLGFDSAREAMDAIVQHPDWEERFDATGTKLVELVKEHRLGGTHNYVIFDDADVSIEQTFAVHEGRPDLANPGTTQAARNLVDETDQQRNEAGQPESRPEAQVQAAAQQRLAADPDGEKQRLLDIANSGGQLDDVQTVIAKSLVNTEGVAAVMSGDAKQLADAIALIDAYRRTGTEQARAFRQRVDPIETPSQRMQRNVTEALLTPPDKIQKKLDAARKDGNQAEIDRLNKEWAAKIEAIKAKLAALGIDLDKLNKWGYSPIRESEVIAVIRTSTSSTGDMAAEYFRNSVLSGPKTHATNTLSNALHGAWMVLAERSLEGGLNKLTRRPEGADLAELPHVIAGILPGWSYGAQQALMTWRTETPTFDRLHAERPSASIDVPQVAIPGAAGKFIRIPQRAMLAADQFARAMLGQMEAGGRAYRIAKSEGLTGDELRTRIATLVADIESPAWRQAYDVASHATFQQSGGPAARALKEAAIKGRNTFWGLPYYVMPFVITPVNILETGIKKSPLGTVDLLLKMRENRAKGRSAMQGLTGQAAQQVIAWTVMAALLGNDEDDPWITGAESAFRRETREQALRTGRQAQSVKIGGKWYSYARLEPFATALAMMVDTANAAKSGSTTRAIAAPAKSLVAQISDKTFLSGIADVVEATQAEFKAGEGEHGEGIGRWASNFAVAWIPNVLRSAGRAADSDMQQRGVWGHGDVWWGGLMDRTLQKTEAPGVDSRPTYDLWGRTIPASTSFVPRTDWAYRLTVPVDNRKEDIFIGDRLLLNWNSQNPGDEKYPAPAQKFYKQDGKAVYMSDEQFADFSRISGQVTSKLVQAESWNTDKPTGEDIDKLTSIISDARSATRQALIAQWNGGPKVADDEQGIAALASGGALRTLGQSRPQTVPKKERDKGVTYKEHSAAFDAEIAKAKAFINAHGITRGEALKHFDTITADLEPKTRARQKGILMSRLSKD
jgi:hypothetical protein